MKERITDILARLDKQLTKEFINDNPVSISFASGHTGIAMFYGYYYLLTKNEEHRDKCESIIERLINRVSVQEKISHTLCDGIAGVAFCANHLMERKVIDADPDFLDDIDDFLLRSCMNKLNKANYDLLHGGLGIATYLFHRGERNYGSLSDVVDALHRRSVITDQGQFWIWTMDSSKDKKPRVNFGLSHGLASIVGFLSHLVKKDMGGEHTRTMLRNTVAYIRNRSNPKYSKMFLPDTRLAFDVEPDVERNTLKGRSRLAWCYGDLGASLPMIDAAEALNDNDLKELSLWMAGNCVLKKTFEETGVADGGLCHGYAGSAHIYNRLFLKTGDRLFKGASEHWTEELFRFIDHHGGIELFKDFNGLTKELETSHTFLKGSAGAGLALISLLDSNISPDWDQVLLLR